MRRAILFATAEAAEEAFYDAMRRGDLVGMMTLWADDDDVVCIHPGGVRLVGLKAVREGFEAMFSDGGIDVHPAQARTYQGAALAVHTLVEKIRVHADGGPRIVDCPATNVYVKVATGWRLVLHHAGPSTEAEGGEFTPESATLH